MVLLSSPLTLNVCELFPQVLALARAPFMQPGRSIPEAS